LKDLLIVTLIVASIISFFTGGEVEALIISVIITINIFVGFTQEYKSENALRNSGKAISENGWTYSGSRIKMGYGRAILETISGYFLKAR
jgi:magnesium-transporting ATPase (P-type)